MAYFRAPILAFVLCSPLLLAQPEVRVGALSFADYFAKLSGDSLELPAQYARYSKGENLFQFRRVQLWADGVLGSGFSARVLLEATDGSLDAQRRYSPFLKEVSLSWESPSPAVLLQLGLIPTPTWRLSEALWGYRSLEKTLTDFWGWGSAVDFGLSLRIRLEHRGHQLLHATAMVSGGEGVRAESNRGKKLLLQCAVQPLPGLWLEGYADWESPTQGRDVVLLKGFLGYQHERLTLGGEFLLRSQWGPNALQQEPLAVSLFGRFRLLELPALALVLRYDHTESDRRLSSAATYRFGLIAVDYTPIPRVHLMPNLWLLTAEQMHPHVVPRVTVFVRYP